MALRALISKPPMSLYLPHLFSSSSRSFSSKPLSFASVARPSSVLRFGRRHLVPFAETGLSPACFARCGGLRCFSTRPTTSSLNDPSPNWSNRPPKETILLDGCDFEHWLVVMEPPEGNPTRDEIIDSYIKTLAQVIGSEDEARMKIYSVSTRCYYAFGALVSEELSYKIKALPRVRWVLPDSYLDVRNKDYGGEPFIDGKAVPYDPKYHEEWIRNNARANERSRRNDRPRNFDRSRNFERRRENMQNRDFQNRDVPPMPNPEFQNRDGQNPMPPRDVPPGPSSMPPRDVPPGPSSMPPRDIPRQQYSNPGIPPNRDFQGRDGANRDAGGMPGFQNQMPGSNMPVNANQGGGGYQSGGGGYQSGGGGSYQGGGSAYQGGGGPYPGSGNAYQGGGGAYQGSGNVPQGGGAPYQGGGQPSFGGGGAPYQGGAPPSFGGGGAPYQGGGQPSHGGGGAYQGSGYPTQGGGAAYQGGSGTYQGSGNAYQGGDMPPIPSREHQ